MTENIYAAPRANLDEHVQSDSDERFYVVSIRKMLIMSIATAGMYLAFWNFKHWSNYRHTTGESVWPLPRAIFSIFFTHSLFGKIAEYDTTGKRAGWSYDRYATAVVLIYIGNTILSWFGGGSYLITFICALVVIPITLLTKQAQVEANARCGDPAGSRNDKLTAANIFWCVLGSLYWLMLLAAMFLPR
jgi:hypothetical protein